MVRFIFRIRARRSSLVIAVATLAVSSGHAQVPSTGGQVSTPESSIEKPGDTGVRAHTNIQIFTPNRGPEGVQAPQGTGAPDPTNSGSPQTLGAKKPGRSTQPQ